MLEHPILTASARFGVRLGLDRMRRFMRALGVPQGRYPMIHVAGTNGKGSVCTMTSSILEKQGYKVGLYTSPHLQRVNERIRLNGREISDKALSAVLEKVDSQRQIVARTLMDLGEHEEPLTYFETITAAAFLFFAESEVDIAVIEVGMGGRLDATNVGNPLVSAITSIGLDHMEQLGPDIPSIAYEKAGIIMPNVPVVVGGVPQEALRVIRSIAAQRGAPIYVYGEDFHVSRDGSKFTWRGSGTTKRDLTLYMPGDHQIDNAAVVLAIMELLPEKFVCVDQSIQDGLANAKINGRLEWLAPDILVDVAHNVDGAVTLASYLRARPSTNRTLLLGVSSDKDVYAIGAMLAPHVSRILTTACAHPRALAPGKVAAALEGQNIPVMPAGSIEEALPLARSLGGEVVVAGSVFLAGAVRELLGR